ncbi:MAG: hypothetical protein L0Z62_45490 [Gemmataceae bacterium]|nr:hypothetical protein [Gemmataceae bacterium]
MADKQELNSVERFRKQPGRLVLEEHGHCEVPAGCGGVVLRWRNPQAALPVTLSCYAPVKAACWIDGEVPATTRIDLVRGQHVLAIALEGVDLAAGLLMFVAVHEPKRSKDTPRSDVIEPPLKIRSQADGTWKFTLQQPDGEDWKTLAFDGSAWPPLVAKPTPQLKWEDFGAYACRRCADQKAACLGLPQPPGDEQQRQSWWQKLLRRPVAPESPVPGNIWIRKVFEIPAPQ